MSRAYRIKVSERLHKVIHVDDHVCTELELLNILPAEQMAELLALELEKEGFKRDGNTLTKSEKDVTIEVDVSTGKVTVSAAKEKELELEAERDGYYYRDTGPSKKKAKEAVKEKLSQELEASADVKQQELQDRITDQLERKLGDVRDELDKAVNRTTAEALKQKAATMGQIKEITEDPESGSLTIVVDV